MGLHSDAIDQGLQRLGLASWEYGGKTVTDVVTVYNIAFGMEFDIFFLPFHCPVFCVAVFGFFLGGRTMLGRFEKNMLLCYAVAHL